MAIGGSRNILRDKTDGVEKSFDGDLKSVHRASGLDVPQLGEMLTTRWTSDRRNLINSNMRT